MIALSIIVGAYASQIFVAAFKAIRSKHIFAANSLGIPKIITFYKIILPQIIKHALPALINLWLVILKDSSIVSLIGLNDIMNEAHIASAQTFTPFNYYIFAAAIYLCLSLLAICLQKYIKQKNSFGEENAVAFN